MSNIVFIGLINLIVNRYFNIYLSKKARSHKIYPRVDLLVLPEIVECSIGRNFPGVHDETKSFFRSFIQHDSLACLVFECGFVKLQRFEF